MDPLSEFPAKKLTRLQEDKLAKQIRKGSTAALTKLVMHNMREAVKYAGYCTGGAPASDLISSCYESLVRSAKKFKPGWIKFFAYCKPAIRGDLKRSWGKKEVVRNAKTVSFEEISQELSRKKKAGDPHLREIPPQVETVTGQISEPDFSGILTRERWEMVKQVIEEVCSERERMVLDLNYRGGLNFQEIASLDGMSRERIRQVHEEALRKVRCALLEKRRLFND